MCVCLYKCHIIIFMSHKKIKESKNQPASRQTFGGNESMSLMPFDVGKAIEYFLKTTPASRFRLFFVCLFAFIHLGLRFTTRGGVWNCSCTCVCLYVCLLVLLVHFISTHKSCCSVTPTTQATCPTSPCPSCARATTSALDTRPTTPASRCIYCTFLFVFFL